MKKILAILLFLAYGLCFGQTTDDKYEGYTSADYPADKYLMKLDSVVLGKVKVVIRQVKLIGSRTNSPSEFYCRGWLTVTKDNQTLLQRYFKSMESVGGCSGLFLPDKQPRKDYIIISKFGDYDGKIFIIDTTGNVTEKIGGVFYISENKRYLFSNYDSDIGGLTVYDLKEHKLLFSSEIEENLLGWYFKNNKYFAIVEDGSFKNGQIVITRFNLNTRDLGGKYRNETVSENYAKPENELPLFNDYPYAKDCSCGH